MKNSQSASAPSGQLRRRLTSALLILSFVVGTIAMTATPAQAATGVGACFKPLRPSILVTSGVPVQLQYWTGTAWVEIPGARQNITYTSTCVGWTIPAYFSRLYLRTWIDYRNDYGYYSGGGTTWATPGSGVVYMMEYVNCLGCL